MSFLDLSQCRRASSTGWARGRTGGLGGRAGGPRRTPPRLAARRRSQSCTTTRGNSPQNPGRNVMSALFQSWISCFQLRFGFNYGFRFFSLRIVYHIILQGQINTLIIYYFTFERINYIRLFFNIFNVADFCDQFLQICCGEVNIADPATYLKQRGICKYSQSLEYIFKVVSFIMM